MSEGNEDYPSYLSKESDKGDEPGRSGGNPSKSKRRSRRRGGSSKSEEEPGRVTGKPRRTRRSARPKK